MRPIMLEAENKSRKDFQEGFKLSLKDQNVILNSHGLPLSNALEEYQEHAQYLDHGQSGNLRFRAC